MEIERINENTVKFYISYIDIEERGFDREEIWYNRERSEELFWEMMDEVHSEAEFVVEGPLWIQVQALEKGLEILVTKTQVNKDGNRFDLPISDDKLGDYPVDEQIEELLDHNFNPNGHQSLIDNDSDGMDQLQFLLVFKDIEDLISLSKRTDLDWINTSLSSYEGRYYLIVDFSESETDTDELIDDCLSILLEYGSESTMTIHRIEEYGNKIIEENVFGKLREHF